MTEDSTEVEYTLPTDQAEKHERNENDNKSDRELEPGVFNPLNPGGDSVPGFVGVDPIYQNYGSETEKPGRAEEGPEADWEEKYLGPDETEGYTAPEESEAGPSDPQADDAKAKAEADAKAKADKEAADKAAAAKK